MQGSRTSSPSPNFLGWGHQVTASLQAQLGRLDPPIQRSLHVVSLAVAGVDAHVRGNSGQTGQPWGHV